MRVSTPVIRQGKRTGWSKKERHYVYLGLAFASPWIIGFLVFTVYPFFGSLYFSLTDYDLFSSPRWVGLDNYKHIIADSGFYKSLGNTLFMAFVSVPITLTCSLLIALLLNTKVKGINYYRTIFYLPSVIPIVASALLWTWMLNPDFGLINMVLRSLGLPDPAWLLDPRYTKPSLILMSLWGSGAGALIFLAALQGVPKQYYEAAQVDGANWWHRFWRITVPALSPIILFQLIMGLIGAFQIFTESYILAGGKVDGGKSLGGPDQSLLFYAVNLYQEAFVYLKMGYASALAWILFLIVLLITFVLLKTSGRWVYYGGD
ncbi:sugar ABC transporter permease [Paenibacillus thiaminolyticus]|uniref:Sugar ABC transporter permease n=1 Tax=Paenibacillus thiaminolyticus TaxID=49283 RepID=A0AAP9DZY4_PANTH|nr:sugar ABC transporter permease [Paenibacillus thiaminolyticus]MCY9534906.1 sugar ABC transporter permease [Paenibacillus thiaminolyticus]MCY9604316.1 sugar ABC transporter permease [Paenibacillus thiaminolyticus]MCY9609586.1 sugar ABC transporter permease [Paenibacillus thiaminolyticus]MCY9612464.1 sugar ABC transporter permease [Paenibacillus thiaminolyticus]MCY9617445.1 sugar ABC transporter permease [Paenibacillus thiaminolyticus]